VDDKRRSLARGTPGGKASAVPLHNLPADGKANARSRTLVLPMETLKGLEYFSEVLFVKSDAVVFHEDTAATVALLAANSDRGRNPVPPVLEIGRAHV